MYSLKLGEKLRVETNFWEYLWGFDWNQSMCSSDTYMICFIQYKNLKSSNLAQIDAKTLVTDQTSILSRILGLKVKRVLSAKVILNYGSRNG